MKYLVLSLTICLSMSSLAEEALTAPKISLRRDEVITNSHFHWVTHKCQTDEDDELETTPQSPPLAIDDPATPGCGKWEINVIVDGDLNRFQNNIELPLMDLNYGIGDNLQLKYEVPNVLASGSGARTDSLGDSKFGVKFQFYGNDESKLQIAVYPQVEIVKPDKKATGPAANTQTLTSLPLLLSTRLARISTGNIMMSLNSSYNFSSDPGTSDSVTALIGVGAPFYHKIAIISELATNRALNSVAGEPLEQLTKVDLGLIGPIGEHFALFGSYGKSLYASDRESHTYFASGVRFLP